MDDAAAVHETVFAAYRFEIAAAFVELNGARRYDSCAHVPAERADLTLGSGDAWRIDVHIIITAGDNGRATREGERRGGEDDETHNAAPSWMPPMKPVID
ncbi:MAG: hypothetical protein AAF684_11945 [Pseudomonadota bacterium]